MNDNSRAQARREMYDMQDQAVRDTKLLSVFFFFFFFFFVEEKLTCPSMPIISAIRKTDKANHWRVSGPQHIL